MKLGSLVWYSVDNDITVLQQRFLALIQELKAPVHPIKAPKLEHVFRRACESIKIVEGERTYDIKDNGYTKRYVSRDIMRKTQTDKSASTLSMGTILFDKDSKEITFTPTDSVGLEDEVILEKILYQIDVFIENNKDSLHALPIRESIRRAIEGDLHGICVKPIGGGLYFVPAAKLDELNKVVTLFARANENIIIEVVEVEDTVKVLGLVADYLFDALMERRNSVLLELGNLREDEIEGKTVLAKDILRVESKIKELEDVIDSYKSSIELGWFTQYMIQAREDLENLSAKGALVEEELDA